MVGSCGIFPLLCVYSTAPMTEMQFMGNDFVRIQSLCIISVNLIHVPRPVNSVHSCSRTYFLRINAC